MNLHQLLSEDRQNLIDEALQAMQRAHLKHYAELGPSSTRERLAALYDGLERSAETKNVAGLIRHVEVLAEERFQAGFDLYEVQSAINVLEETVWKGILRELEPGQYTEALGVISSILGLAKDCLARTYVSLASRSEAPDLDLSALLSGRSGASQRRPR